MPGFKGKMNAQTHAPLTSALAAEKNPCPMIIERGLLHKGQGASGLRGGRFFGTRARIGFSKPLK